MEQKRTWVYCRVAHPDAHALAVQQRNLEAYAETHGYEIIGTTAEQASGLDFSRRGLVEVSSTVVDGKIDFLLVANLSRLGRDVGKMDAYLRWLEDWFVEVVCADGTVPQTATEILHKLMQAGQRYSYKPKHIIGFVWFRIFLPQRCVFLAQLERETIQKRVTDAYYSRCLKGFHMSGQAPYGFRLEPTTVEGSRTKMMVPDPAAADHVRLMFEMYAEPGTSFGDISRYFEENDIKVHGKSLFRPFLSQLLRNPVYAQADLELYEFFKSQGAAVVNDAADFAGTNGCYLYQGRDVKEDKDRSLKDQILVIAPHEGLVSSDTWLKCRKKLMANITFQNGRKARNTWLAGKVKCGKCGYALKVTCNPSGYEYLRCNKRSDHKGCPGCGTLRKAEFEQFIFTAMGEKFRDFKHLRGGEEKANPKLTAYQVELAQVEAEIEKLLDTLTGANATLLAYANKKIEELDTRRQKITKAIADLSVETISQQQIDLLSGYLDDWENISFEDKRKATDGLISSISATSEYVKIEWKI